MAGERRLTALEELNLSGNELSGAIPSTIGDLLGLIDLWLWGNQLSGSIPSTIGNLSSLVRLDLGGNQISGPIPLAIAELTTLEWLYLWSNQLSGSIPPEIGQLTTLERLHLGGNQFGGVVPSDIGALSQLRFLGLESNQLTDVPAELGTLATLEELYLHSNLLSGEIPASLTGLMGLNTFSFNDTQWCAPAVGAVPTWLSQIGTVYGTGLTCGQQALGRLEGRASLPDASPVAGIQVSLYRTSSSPVWQHITTTTTIADGSYVFTDLGEGVGVDNRVRFVDRSLAYAPQYFEAQPGIAQATAITITPGIARLGINATLRLPEPAVIQVDPGHGGVVYGPDGGAQVTLPLTNPGDVTVTRSVVCSSGTPSAVTLSLSPGSTYPMANVGGGLYRATVPAADLTEDVTLRIAEICTDSSTETLVGSITLFDPNGMVRDAATDDQVSGAFTMLYYVPGWLPKIGPDDDRPNTCESNLPRGTAPWSQSAPTELGMLVDGDVTPIAPALPYQQTADDGSFGWDLPLGCWYVTVEADGYAPLTGPLVGVPPDVTDMDLVLCLVESLSPPMIESADKATFVVGEWGSFSVIASGYPTPTLGIEGALPGGVTFTPESDGTATLAGTPVGGSDDTYLLTMTATNGVQPDAAQAFTLTVEPGEWLVFLPLVVR